ncbi:MAG TPA: hypothetical protein VF593_08700 [Chthoniobacteraceae bacterium]
MDDRSVPAEGVRLSPDIASSRISSKASSVHPVEPRTFGSSGPGELKIDAKAEVHQQPSRFDRPQALIAAAAELPDGDKRAELAAIGPLDLNAPGRLAPWHGTPARSLPAFPLRTRGSGSNTTTPPAELVLELEPGTREPVAFADAGEDRTIEQSESLAGISSDFDERVKQAAPDLSDDALSEVWESEQMEADSQYRILFGDSAFNQRSMETALHALGLAAE